MSDPTPPTHGGDGQNAIRSADNLAAAFNDFTDTLKSVKIRQWVQTAFLAGVLVLSGLTMAARADACHDDNELRGGLLDLADLLESSGGDTPSRTLTEFVAQMRTDFQLQECSFPWL